MTLIKIIKKIYVYIHTHLWQCCWSCGKIQVGNGFCIDCWKNIHFIPDNHCIFCKNSFQFDNLECIDCGYRSMALTYYKGPICKIIMQLKYGRRFYFGKFLINLISNLAYDDNYYILYVPHYKLKQVTTSVNSSLVLAHCFAQKFGGKVIHNVLYKTSKKRQKDSTNYKERSNNAFDNYGIRNGHLLKNQSVILIDDVITTGSTINACARLIKSQSPKDLRLIVICKV